MYSDILNKYRPIIGTGDIKFISYTMKRLLPEYIYDISKYENVTYTFDEIVTILEGTVVGGHSRYEYNTVENLRRAYMYMLNCVDSKLDCTINDIHARAAYDLVETSGTFRTMNIQIAGVPKYTCPAPIQLYNLAAMLFPVSRDIESILATYCALVYYQFFQDCNKRTARIYCNYLLMSNGIGIMNVSHKLKPEFNKHVRMLFETGNSQPLMEFLAQHCLMLFSDRNIILDAYR